MEIVRATLAEGSRIRGTVVVIDVLRAFTTAAYAFAAGAREIILVSEVHEAFSIRGSSNSVLLMGEIDGLPIRGFDYSNSPSALMGEDLTGVTLVQRTTAGTQGVVRAGRATKRLATGLCTVGATVNYLKRHPSERLTLLETGRQGEYSGAEDVVCADLIEQRLRKQEVDLDEIVARVKRAPACEVFFDESLESFPVGDVDCAVQVDKFDFAMVAEYEDGRHVLRKVG